MIGDSEDILIHKTQKRYIFREISPNLNSVLITFKKNYFARITMHSLNNQCTCADTSSPHPQPTHILVFQVKWRLTFETRAAGGRSCQLGLNTPSPSTWRNAHELTWPGRGDSVSVIVLKLSVKFLKFLFCSTVSATITGVNSVT